MRHTPILTEEKLDTHADYAETSGILPELIFRLITVTVQNPREFRIPFGGSVGQGGLDCLLSSPIAIDPFIPEGVSYWELGRGGSPQDKATADFRKRTESTSEDERRDSTFVFVTPRSASHCWSLDQQKTWLNNRKDKGWRAIRIIDGTKLVQWLSLYPEIDHWLASRVGLSTAGLSSPSLHWEVVKTIGAPPELPPELFLVKRAPAVSKVVGLFEGGAQELRLDTRFPEEGVDFVSATLASLEEDQQASFSGRCLVIDNPDTWIDMCALPRPHVLVATPALDLGGAGSDLRQQARIKGHSVIFTSSPSGSSHGNSERLGEAKPYEVEAALKSAGYDPERARSLANRSGGRTTILKRLILDLSVAPDWGKSDKASDLALAAMIGRWNGDTEGDREAIEACLGKGYGEWIRDMRPLTLIVDPPLTQIDEKWKFISRFEGWLTLGQYLSNEDLDRFGEMASQVLATDDPRLDLPVEDRWQANALGTAPTYSNNLRKGIGETLALLGSHPDALTSCSSGKPQSVPALVVRELLNSRDWRRWASLRDVLPLLAEAAPDEFLSAVESAVANGGDPSPFPAQFAQESSGFTGTNYLTGLLWALELLSWSEDYIVRATVVLGALDKMDPGGNWTNRPRNSLTTIYLPWLPQTCAPIAKRGAAIKALQAEYPDHGLEAGAVLVTQQSQHVHG